MTSTKFGPLHLEPPRLMADDALGEHLAALARASTSSAASRVRRSGWKVPLAALATIAASGSVAYAGQAALHGQIRAASPGVTPTSTPSATATHTRSIGRPAAPVTPRRVHTNPHGKTVGKGHPKTGKTSKTSKDAKRAGNPGDKAERRKAVGSAGDANP